VYHIRPLTLSLTVNITLDQRQLLFPNGNLFSIVLNHQDSNVPTIKLDMNDYNLRDGAHEVMVHVNVNTGVNSKPLSGTKFSYFYFHTLNPPVTQETAAASVYNDIVVGDGDLYSTSKTVRIVYPKVPDLLTCLLKRNITHALTYLLTCSLIYRITVLSIRMNSPSFLLFHQ